ncbi:MAG TPA: hypothetical protein VK722_17195 [Candidatus Aquilonibacter sp.]|jgi:hypothetical protein|nr:hypothetical protein [Candidatus Aquilonibacter sp.]
MKWALAVVLLLISFVSVALADGSDIPPAKSSTLSKVGVVLLSDGSDIPPLTEHARPLMGEIAA